MYQDTFEVEVNLASKDYVSLIEVLVSFKVTAKGEVYALTLDGIAEVHSDLGPASPLIFTQYEMAQIRFEVAEAIERKYQSGMYKIA